MAKVKLGSKKKQNGYKMPDPLPQGEVLEDVLKKKWCLGTSIGKGGFGEIYSAQEWQSASTKANTFPYVIKIEPHNNGPLFVEMHFFMRNAKKTDIDMFMSSKKITSFGMPVYCGSGSHEYKGTKYRFVVMERFGSDIWKMFLENKRIFSEATVYKIGMQILDVLEYIHSKGYVHADIKGANILLDLKNKNQVYLVDFGLAVHYFTGDKFKPDPKKAHDGTIEYLSRDAHQGVQTRRGDLEILLYNLIQWLGCTLPWEKDIKDPVAVKQSKEKHMDNIPLFMNACFGTNTPPATILDLLKYHKTLNFNTEIDYKKIKTILAKGLKTAGGSPKSPLQFKTTKSPIKRKNDAETPLSGKKKKINRRKLLANCTDDDGDEKENCDDDSDYERMEKPRNETPKKRGRQPKVKKIEREVEDDNEEDDSDDAGKSNGYTAEMRRIMEKMEASKKTKGRRRIETKKEDAEDKRECSPEPSTPVTPRRIKKKKVEAVEERESSPEVSSSTAPLRGRRNRKQVNYNESSVPRKRGNDEDIVSSSEAE